MKYDLIEKVKNQHLLDDVENALNRLDVALPHLYFKKLYEIEFDIDTTITLENTILFFDALMQCEDRTIYVGSTPVSSIALMKAVPHIYNNDLIKLLSMAEYFDDSTEKYIHFLAFWLYACNPENDTEKTDD